MKTTFLIIRVVTLTHDNPVQVIGDLEAGLMPVGQSGNKEVIKSEIIELQSTEA